MSMIIGIDHGYYAIKTVHCSFPAGLTSYGEHEPYTRQGLLEFGGCFFVCGSGRQPIQRDKTINDNYYLLTLAAIAKEIRQRGLPPECSVRIAAGLPLTSFGRDKPKFKDYLLRSNQPVNFKFEGVEYSITIEEVAVFPQGYAALMTETGLLQDEPSMLLMDLGGWTVDLMRIDNAIPAADTAHSLELGMIRCVDDIREQVRRKTGLYEVGVPIKCATKTGYQLAQVGDSIDLSYATVNSRRGRVGKEIAHTLTTGCRQGTVEVCPVKNPIKSDLARNTERTGKPGAPMHGRYASGNTRTACKGGRDDRLCR